MKKTIIGMGICALLIGTASCSKKNTFSQEDKQLGDSLSLAMGQVMGAQIRSTLERQRDMNKGESSLNVEKIIRGMESVLYADTTDERSYIQGIQIGLTLMQQPVVSMEREGFPFNADMVLKGFQEAVKDSLNGEQYWMIYQELDKRSKTVARNREINKNGELAKHYIDSLKKANPNVVTTESGLSYIIEQQGIDVYPTPSDSVLVNYKGSLIDGTVFDDHSTGEPVKFPLKGVVKGFSEGLTLIGEGGEATLIIPGELGYGDAGQPRAGIGPNATLIFDVKVVKVLPVDEAQ